MLKTLAHLRVSISSMSFATAMRAYAIYNGSYVATGLCLSTAQSTTRSWPAQHSSRRPHIYYRIEDEQTCRVLEDVLGPAGVRRPKPACPCIDSTCES